VENLEKISSQKKNAEKKPKAISQLRKPDDMTLEEWQVALRKTFSQTQKFRLKPLGTPTAKDNYFPHFLITNKTNKSSYNVEIFGTKPFENYCSCPDFSINTLGTCKHIEFALRRLLRNPKLKEQLSDGWSPKYSQIVLRYGPQRAILLKPGRECPQDLLKMSKKYFDASFVMKNDAFSQFDEFIHSVKKTGHDLKLREDAISYVAQVRDKDFFKKAGLTIYFQKGLNRRN